MTKHVTKYFLEWHENRLPKAKIEEIGRHLDECDACREYFVRMRAALSPLPSEHLQHLAPDPFLPSRAKALAGDMKRGSRVAIPVLRLSAASLVLVLAMAIGFVLGKGLMPQQEQQTKKKKLQK